jgi:hypothetical protein
MRRSLVISLVAAVVVALCAGFTTASAAPSAGSESDGLDAYTAVVQADQLSTIAEQGVDVSGQRPVAGGIELDMVLDRAQADRLRGRGVDVKLTMVKGGKTVRQFAAEEAADGFTVWRSYDEPGGIRDQLYAAARNHPQLVKLEVLGQTDPGRSGHRRRHAAGRVVQRDPACPRMDLHRGRPTTDELLHRSVERQRP